MATILVPSSLGAADTTAPTIRVDGVAVVTLRPATRIDDEWSVPLEPIAFALGATVSVLAGSQGLRILRRDGVIVDYDSRTGRFRQGNMLVGELQNFREVQIAGPLGTLLFPLSGVVILLGVTVREDRLANVLELGSSVPAAGGSGAVAPRFQASKLEYLYSLASTGAAVAQSLSLTGEALAGADRITATVALAQEPGSSDPKLQRAAARMELTGGRTFLFGDQGTYAGVDAMSDAVRGLGYIQPLGLFQVQLQAGRAAGSVSSVLGSSGIATYDTDFVGLSARRIFKTAEKDRRAELSLGLNLFQGPNRKGGMFGTAYSDRLLANQFKVQGLIGEFSGDSERLIPLIVVSDTRDVLTAAGAAPAEAQSAPIHVQGLGYGYSATDTFNPFRSRWVLMGDWEYYSRNFLPLMANSRFSAVKRRSASTVVQPFRYLTFNGGISDSVYTLGDADRSHGYNYGANASLPAGIPLSLGYFRTIQANTGLGAGRFDMAQYSLQMPHVGRFSASTAFTELHFNGQTSHLVNGNFSANTQRLGRLSFHYQSQLGSNTNAGLDWARTFGKKKTGYVRVGVERESAVAQTNLFAPVVSLRLPSVRGQELNFSYIGMRGLSLLQLSLGGSLIGHRELLQVDGISAMLVPASLDGQVYWDVNDNGKYDADVDHPLPRLQITLDGQETTVTDASGYFRFERVNPGTHRLRIAMESVPARLVFTDGDEHMAAVLPYRDNRQDFRAAEAGRIAGRVMIMPDGFFEREPPLVPLPDVHILASKDRETFSEGDGTFILADLAPGSYVLRLDPASIPRGLVAKPESRSVVVKPGQTLEAGDFRLERPVIVKPGTMETPHAEEAKVDQGVPLNEFQRLAAPHK